MAPRLLTGRRLIKRLVLTIKKVSIVQLKAEKNLSAAVQKPSVSVVMESPSAHGSRNMLNLNPDQFYDFEADLYFQKI